MEIGVTAPELLTEAHVLQPFDCGNDVLSDWLRRRAMKNQLLNASRTFVICLEGTRRVWGIIRLPQALSAMSIWAQPAAEYAGPGADCFTGRLAVDVCTQGHCFGKWLLSDAVMRVSNLADQVGIKAVMVHAIDDKAREFYQYFGFVPSPIAPNTLFYKI